MRINSKNERLKKLYFEYLQEAKQHSVSTIDNIRGGIARWEEFMKYKEFSLNKDTAIKFKKHLAATKAKQSGEPLSVSTINSTVGALKDFFLWLSHQKGYKKKISVPNIAFLNLSENDVRAAKAVGFKPYPTIEQIEKVIKSMVEDNEVSKRNRALISFTLLTGMRDGAIASLKLKHIDLENGLVKQDPHEVKTKFRKRIDTFFFPVDDFIKQIFIDWVNYLTKEKLFGPNDPVFPRTRLATDEIHGFNARGLEPVHWNGAGQIREIFRISFETAGLNYYPPHTFRKTLVNLGEKLCKTPEHFKAWSQNLGHESPLTTFTSYGYVDVHRQGDIIKGLGKESLDNSEETKTLLKKLLEKF